MISASADSDVARIATQMSPAGLQSARLRERGHDASPHPSVPPSRYTAFHSGPVRCDSALQRHRVGRGRGDDARTANPGACGVMRFHYVGGRFAIAPAFKASQA